MSPLVSLDSMLTLGQGSPWKGQQNSDVKHQVNHSERCKGDMMERIIKLSLVSPNRNTDITSENCGRTSTSPSENFWEIGKFRRCRKSKRTIGNVLASLEKRQGALICIH